MGKKKVMAAAVDAPAAPVKDGGPNDYEAHHAYDTISRAQEHMADDDMMGRVKAVAGRKAKAATGLNDLMTKKTAKPKINSLADVKAAGKAMRSRGAS